MTFLCEFCGRAVEEDDLRAAGPTTDEGYACPDCYRQGKRKPHYKQLPGQEIPEPIRESLERYAVSRVPTGGFLAAVLANDLFDAAARADEVNVHYLKNICAFVFNRLPIASWGSREKVVEWTKVRVVSADKQS